MTKLYENELIFADYPAVDALIRPVIRRGGADALESVRAEYQPFKSYLAACLFDEPPRELFDAAFPHGMRDDLTVRRKEKGIRRRPFEPHPERPHEYPRRQKDAQSGKRPVQKTRRDALRAVIFALYIAHKSLIHNVYF